MVRIAVVQLDFHPAFYDDGRSLLGEPLGRLGDGTAARLPLEGVPGVAREELAALQGRVATEYEAALARKLAIVLEQCREWGVRIVVFPEYAIPAGCLRLVADAARGMVVVAGTHHVGKRERQSGIYGKLGVERPPRGTAVAPVLHDGRALALVPKCRAAPIADEARSLNPGAGWAPVDLPSGFPSPLAVAICIDFVAEERPACADPGVSLDEVCLWAVPSLTPTVEDFHAKAREQAKRRKRPVAFANSEREGQSGIFVDRRADDRHLVPLVLGPKEEGIVVADVSLKSRGPGRSTGWDEPVVVEPVAAASFVYTATTADEAYWAWIGDLERILSEGGEEALESDLLEEHVHELRQQSFGGMPPTRRNRHEALVHRVSGLTKLEQLRCLTREVVFPADVLPLDGLRAALADGARDVLDEWLERDPANTAAMKDVAVRYAREAKAVLGDGAHRWADRARKEAERVARVVRAGARKEVREYEKLAGTLTFYAEALEEGLDRDFKAAGQAMDDERFEEARDALGAMLDRAEQRVLADPERREARAWRARLRLMKAITLFNLHDTDAAASEVRTLERDALPAAHWRDFVVLLAELGELTDARAFLAAAAVVELPEQVRIKLDRAALHVELCAGQRPRDLPDDAPDLLRKAAQLELEQGRLVDAVRHARRAVEREPLVWSTRLISLHVLVIALELSVFEIGAPGRWLTKEGQAETIETIEAWLVDVDAWRQAGRALRFDSYDGLRRRYFELVEDGDRLPPGVPPVQLLEPIGELLALAEQGQVEQALARVDQLPSTGSRWLDELRRINLVAQVGHTEADVEHLNALSRRFPGRAPIERRLARALAQREDLQQAVHHAQQAVELLPCSGHRFLLARYLYSLGYRERAWNVLVVDRDRGNPHALELLAQLAEARHPAEALTLWERFVALRPERPGARIQYALALRRAGRASEAAKLSWEVMERFGDELSVEGLHACAMLQDLGDGKGLTSIAKERMKQVSSRLQEQHSSSPRAQLIRVEIRKRVGDADDTAPVDLELLEQAGLARGFSSDEIAERRAELTRLGEAASAARWKLYGEGGVPLEAVAAAEGRALGELISEMLDGDDGPRFCSYVALADPAFDPTTPLQLLMSETELLLLVELDLDGAFHTAMRRRVASVVLPEDGWKRLQVEREVEEPATDARRRAAQLARRASELIRSGQEERWLSVHDWVELTTGRDEPHVPPLRDQTLDDELLRQPLLRGLWFVAAARAQPGRWRVAADVFATWGAAHPLVASLLSWADASEYLRLAELSRSGRDRTMSFPALVRLVAGWGDVDERHLHRILTRLARSGFVDALTAEDLVALSREDGALSRLEHALAGQEHMARAGYLGVAEPAQLALVGAYARACFLAHLRGEEGLAAAGSLTSMLLSRLEVLGNRGELLEFALVQLGAMTLDDPRMASIPIPEGGNRVSFSRSTPTGHLWARLAKWGGQDGQRRRALERASRNGWCLLDRLSGETGPLRFRSVPLMLASSFERGRGPAEANEALVILSALWEDQPLEEWTFVVENSGRTIIVSYLDCLQHAIVVLSEKEHENLISLDEREICLWFPLEAPLGPIPVRIPIEGVILRAEPATARAELEGLRSRQGRHDGGAYRLIGGLLEAPDDPVRRRNLTRHAATALWRLVRDDPAYLLQWPRQRSPVNGSWPTIESLCEMLHEPTTPIGEARNSSDVFSERMDETWAGLHEDVRSVLFFQLMRFPGGLAASSVGPRVRDHVYAEQVEEALHRLERPSSFPAGLLANDVMFLRVAMALRPEVELKRGALDLRTVVPPLLASLLAVELAPPPGSLADDEPRLLRAMGIVVREILARHRDRGAHDYLWLTYRLHGWFLDQLAAAREEAKASGLARIHAIASKVVTALPSDGTDLFDPFTFDARHFDYRLSVILFAMLAGEELVRDTDLVGTLEPPPVSTPGLEEHLLELARRERPNVSHASSWFSWNAPDNAPDLALTLLLGLHAERVLELGDEHLAQRIQAWSEDVDALPEPRKQVIDGMVRVLAANCSKLDEDLRWQLGLKLSAFEHGPLARKLRWLGLTGLYAAGSSELETQVRASLQEHLTEPEAPMMASLFLRGLAAHRPQDLDAEVTHLYEASRTTPDRAIEVLTVAVARLVIHGDAELARRASRLLTELAARPGFRDDPRLHELLEHLHLEDEPDEP